MKLCNWATSFLAIRDGQQAIVVDRQLTQQALGVSTCCGRSVLLRRVKEIGRRVKAAAYAISAKLGHVPAGAGGPDVVASSRPRVPHVFRQSGKARTAR